MKHHRRHLRRLAPGRRFLLDWLEPRCLLATGLPGINAVTFDTSTNPPQVEITFNQKDVSQIDGLLAPGTGLSGIANFSMLLNVLDSSSDFEIDRTGTDGAILAQVLGPDNPPAVENVSYVTVAGVQAVQVAIPITGTALQPGHYQVGVEGSTPLDYLFDTIEPGAAWDSLSAAIQPLTIGQFAVYGQGASFQNATLLPSPGSAVTTVTGYLNPDDYRSAVDLYQFTLGPTSGNLWEVGLAVQAHDIGSPLQADITLFGPGGQVVASALSGSGLPGDPDDPYLFDGLQPGTYNVAVSGAGYLPYGSTGYNPELGIPGVLGQKQPGGPFPFEISFVAIANPTPTLVKSSSPNWLDPLSPSPTSLTLDLSGPIDLSNLFVVDQAEGALELVNSTGSVWPITAGSYDISQHQLTMIVDEPLPAGSYRLISPSSDPLTDLAGQPVVVPGEPAGVLGTFSVAAPSGQTLPGDLGVLWPNQIGVTPASIGDTSTGSGNLSPGQTVTYRFVAIVPGLYKLQTVMDGGAISVQLIGSAGISTLNAGSVSSINNYFMKLGDGVYQIRFTALGTQPAQFEWRLKIASADWEKIIGNGVGQGSALALGLLSTSTIDPSASSPSLPSGSEGALTIQGANIGGGPSGPISSSLFVSLDTTPMGQPGSTAASLASVGPAVDGALVALADSARGLEPNFRYISTDQADLGPDAQPPAGAANGPVGEAKGAGAKPAGNRLDPDAASILADERALAGGEWLVRLAGMVRNWFGPMPIDARPSPSDLDPAHSVTTVRAGLGLEERTSGTSPGGILDRTAHADVEFPAGLLLIAVAAHRLQHPVRRWWRRRGPARGKGHRAFGSVYPAPHAPSTFARMTTRVPKERNRAD